MRGEELPKWALFSPFSPPGQGRDSVWLFMSVWESKRGCGETHQPSLLRGLGWAEVPVIGSVLSYIYMHMHAQTLLRTPPRAARTQERTLLRGRFGK